MVEHSPLPWRLNELGPGLWIEAANGVLVLKVLDWRDATDWGVDPAKYAGEARANAELVVAAVNAAANGRGRG